jgi:hypothetical protein
VKATSLALVVAAAISVAFAAGCSRRSEPTPSDASPRGSAASTDSGSPGRASLECLTVEAPPGSTKAAAVGGGLAFHGAKQLRSGTVSYDPAFTVSTQAAEGSDANRVRDELMTTFTEQFAQVLRSASASKADGFQASDLQPPKSTAARVAGLPGHAWQIDSVATFNGERLPWRAFSMTTVHKDRVYVVTAAAALSNVGELKPVADRFFASMRFDGCP